MQEKSLCFTIENVVKDVSLSQIGCEVNEDGLVMIDSGASVNVCPKWFGESILQESDGSVQLRGADGRTLQDDGKRQIWLKIGNHLRQYDFHVVEVTKPILSVSYLCEKRNRSKPRERNLPEVRRQTRTLNQERRCVLRQSADRSQSQGHNRVMRTSRRFTKLFAYEQEIHKVKKIHAYELKIPRNHAYGQEIHRMNKSHVYELMDCRIHENHAYELKIHKSHGYELKIHKSTS